MSVRTQIFEKLFRTVELFGFRRYDGPILESAAIYEAKSGKEIVDEQMYRLKDKKGRELALRPEMTPSIARIIAGHQNEIVFPSRWYCHANCHRYEKPQRGRVREHWQLNVDIFGSKDFTAEIEMFDLITALMESLGADKSMYAIRVNDRILFESALMNYVGVKQEDLGAVGLVIDRWEKNTSEIRRKSLQEIGLKSSQIDHLEKLVDFDLELFAEAAGEEAASRSRIVKILREGLTDVPLRFDPHIIRAFDYYTSTVFEVFDLSPSNRRSLFGGGRYDNLTSLFSNRRISGIGCGMGDVTTWNFLEHNGLLPEPNLGPDVFVFATSDEYLSTSLKITRYLRGSEIRTIPALDSPSLGEGLRLADRMGARYAVIIGDIEHESGKVSVKDLMTTEQVTIPDTEVVQYIKDAIN